MSFFYSASSVPASKRPNAHKLPQIVVNGPSVSPARSRNASTSNGSSAAIENLESWYYDFGQTNPDFNQPYPNSGLMGRHGTGNSLKMAHSRDYSTSFNDVSTTETLHGVGSLHFSQSEVPRQSHQYTSQSSRTENGQLTIPGGSFPSGMSGSNVSYLGLHANVGDKTPSSDSDGFALVHHDCIPCQYNGQKLRDLEVKNQELENQNQSLLQKLLQYEQVRKQQHSIMVSQQKIIEQGSGEHRPGQLLLTSAQSRKRTGSPTLDRSEKPIPFRARDALVPVSSSKRAKFPPQQRQQTAETRSKGACVRCWKHKQRCEPGRENDGPCKSCSEPSLSVIRIPCIRTHIVDISLFRLGTGHNDTWVKREEVNNQKDLSTYLPEGRKILELTHRLGSTLKVHVKRYLPIRDEVTDYTWWDGQGNEHSKQTPHYAICDIDNLKPAINTYIVQNQNNYIREYISQEHVVTSMAFKIAQKYAEEDKSRLLQDTLRLWMTGRLIEKQWQICGKETLGLQSDSHWKFIPITPIMDTQLDQVVIKSFLQPMRESVLRRLQTKIEKECRKSSFEILVCIIILLSTLEEAIRHDHEFATFFGHEYSPGRQRFEDYELIESYFHAATTLIAHVKMALDGKFPHLDANADVSKLLGAFHNHDEQNFMIKIDNYLHTNEREIVFTRIRQRHEYEAHQFWVHQLFLKSWNGTQIHIREKQPQ